MFDIIEDDPEVNLYHFHPFVKLSLLKKILLDFPFVGMLTCLCTRKVHEDAEKDGNLDSFSNLKYKNHNGTLFSFSVVRKRISCYIR